MKKLIICCDGTWNNPEQEDNGQPAPTNVFKISNCVAQTDTANNPQMVYYHPGLGGEGGLFKPIVGGAFGAGITRHICSAYHWLCTNYQPGDQIFLYGFSRGAFTVRSLGGFLRLGLIDLAGVDDSEGWSRVHRFYEEGYRNKKTNAAQLLQEGWHFQHDGNAAPIRFLGVWDTVGALGIPDDLELLNILDDKSKWQFFDTELKDHIQTARHAIAIDEIRSSFTVTRWSNADTHGDAKEMWFPGVHCDVGGGYAETDLSNGPLLWMIEESETVGLQFRPGIKDRIKCNPNGVMHNSFRGAFKALRCRPRNIPPIVESAANNIHSSALIRQKDSPIDYPQYRPTKLLKPGDSPHTIDIYADQRWNDTGLYLEKGAGYRFSVKGQWKDAKDACGWEGTEDGKFTRGDLVRAAGTLLGQAEKIFHSITKNDSTDFLLTRRVEELGWFVLVGAIANDGGHDTGVGNDGSPTPHQYVQLSKYKGTTLHINAPGYLYCFANDVWQLYENNSGYLTLTIERVS